MCLLKANSPSHYSYISRQKKAETTASVINNGLKYLAEWLTEFSLDKAKIELIKIRSFWKQLPRDFNITCNNNELFIDEVPFWKKKRIDIISSTLMIYLLNCAIFHH